MSILLTGDVSQVKAWGRRQYAQRLSYRSVLGSASPGAAQAFTRVCLHVVHRALSDLSDYVNAQTRPYLVAYLHQAIVTVPFSRWIIEEDDVRGVVALEIAHRARNALVHGLVEPSERASALKGNLEDALKRLRPPVGGKTARARIRPELVTYIYGRVLEDLAEESVRDIYLSKLERLRLGFGLNRHELARLLKVTPEAIRKWIRGGGISPDVRGTIDSHVAVLDRLETYVRPGLLPSVLRRPAKSLANRRPIELLLEGQGESIVEYFEELTSYASTA